jgi:hypothetical protein
MVARASPSAFVRWLAHSSRAIKVATEFFEQVADLLRQLVHVVGWLVLLVGVVKLLIYPHLSLEHLVVPGTGALAVLQSLIRPRRQQEDAMVILQEVTPELAAELSPGDMNTEREAEALPSPTADL